MVLKEGDTEELKSLVERVTTWAETPEGRQRLIDSKLKPERAIVEREQDRKKSPRILRVPMDC